jgi:hypothetical protein
MTKVIVVIAAVLTVLWLVESVLFCVSYLSCSRAKGTPN